MPGPNISGGPGRPNPDAPPTPEQIAGSISAMRDSVWAITDAIEKTPTKQTLGTIGRNVGHLELQMSNEHISGSGEDLSDITNAIAAGKAFEEEHKALLTEE
jgi:hypothetical protein